MLSVFARMSCAQNPEGSEYKTVVQSPPMRWICPDIAHYKGILADKQNDDYKIYANSIKEDFELLSVPGSPEKKFLVTQAILTVENPMYNADNLIDYISKWFKDDGWGEYMDVDKQNKQISSIKTHSISSYASFFEVYKVFGTSKVGISIVEKNKLLITFALDSYKVEQYNSQNSRVRSFSAKISEVYPFEQKSSQKNTYATAYVSTYKYFWDVIDRFCRQLNAQFSRDDRWISALRYEYKTDSLKNMYGELTKAIVDNPAIQDVDKEIRFYEKAQKVVVMGHTIDFKDIISCEITDDPKIIPGKSTTVGGGLSIFGIGLGGAETYTAPNQTIHNYVVKIKIDNLEMPFLHMATGRNESKANEILASFEYIVRRQNEYKNQTTTTKNRK